MDGLGTGDEGLFALTGPLVTWGCVVLAISAFVLGVWLVPALLRRHAVPLWRARLTQAVTLVLCSALVLLATCVVLNRSYVFYGSWDDLFDTGTQGISTALFGAARGTGTEGGAIGHQSGEPGDAIPLSAADAQALRRARTAPPTALQAAPLHDPALRGIQATGGGQYVTVRIPGSRSRLNQQVVVYLPAGYTRQTARRYPVLLAFSGIPGSPRTWERAFEIGPRIEQLARAGTLSQAIVVMPVVYPGSHDSECVDADHGPQYETWLTQDVPDWVRTHLRTVESPMAWATIGYSAGGWCATMLSVRHPELARASISLGGYFQVDYAPRQRWTAPDDPRYNLPEVAARTRPPVTMYFFAGGEDRLSDSSLHRMETAVADPTALTVRRSRHGGHMVPLWAGHLALSLRWLGGHAAGFDPRAVH